MDNTLVSWDEYKGQADVLPDAIAPLNSAKSINHDVRAISLRDFLAKDYPPRVNLLSPWLPSSGLAMIYAWRGIGKTQVALRVGYAVATGGEYLGWHAPEPQPVLYIDGEMPAVAMQERLGSIVKASEADDPPDNYFKLITPDEQLKTGMPDLGSIEGQGVIEADVQQAKLIIIDNISTLVRSGAENKGDDWLAVQQWALRLRSEGKSVLFVHHSSKNGTQRGTSRREDVLDTVLCLKRPPDYEDMQGARFQVSFEKCRGVFGKDVEPFEASLITGDSQERWERKTVDASTYQQVIELSNLGMSQTEIAKELDVNKSTVSRHYKKAVDVGEIARKVKGVKQWT